MSMAYSFTLDAVRTTWPFAGRMAQLAAMGAAIRGGRGVVVAGPAGVGKSRLAARAVSEAAGFSVAAVRATEAAAELPFGAFAHLLPAPPSDRVNPLQWAAGELSATGLLLVDDAHLLDGASAALVHHLVRYGGVRVVATVRTGEATADAVIALWKDGLVPRLELAPLSVEEAGDALGGALGGPVEERTVRRLWEVSQGNPLFLRELVLAGQATGSLGVGGGSWRWQGELAVTTRLRELVDRRIGAVTDAEREVLELVAYGEPFGAELLGRLGSAQVLEGLEDRQLVSVVVEGRRLQVRLAHPLYGQAVRARCGTLRTRRVLLRLAEAVEAAGLRRREDALRVALWRLDSGTAADPRLLLEACRVARLARDLGLAERLARAASAAGGGAEADLHLSRILHYMDRYEEAEEVLQGVRLADDLQRMEYVAARSFNLYWGLGREGEARALADEVGAGMSEPVYRQGMDVLRAVMDSFAGDLVAAEAGLARVVALGPLPEEGARSLTPLRVSVCAFDGRAVQALELVEGNSSEAFPSYQAALLEYGVVAALLVGDLRAAERYSAAGLRLAEEFGAWNRALVGFGVDRARVCRLRGESDEALRLCREAAARLPRRSVYAGGCLGELAHVLAMRGDAAAAGDALRAAAEMTVSQGHSVVFPVRLARTWVLAVGGDLAAAVRNGVETAGEAASRGLRAYEVTAWHDLVRLGAAHLAESRLARLAGEVEGPLVGLLSRHATACVSKDGVGLDALSAEFAALELRVHAAEAAAQAAVVHDGEGNVRAAQASRTRAWSLARDCPGVRTPALVRLVLPELTARQREVAALAAEGLTNRQIADRLVLSIRTVANHLGAVYERLGVGDRVALGEILSRLD
ncbi:LuxR family transcriptional regulator [Planotetraspora silvatica]|uniref:LuxR family transcriptional regulator n=1 Tax=Planotetraspora silvatica TaxID=234614 RepID=A0A8J3XP21_9ACTN|nr:LuxR family transcriptional regulator [Planotetraspora silvatica]